MNPPLPTVSVVMPAYNVRHLIGEALRSVFAQDGAQLEVIVVDDGSKDGTADFVETEFPAVRVLRKVNGGAATARNLGMQEARGDYIAFLDADDVWLPGKLRVQLDYMRVHPEVRMICGGFSFWLADEQGVFPDPASLHPALENAELDVEHSGWVYHKLLLSNFVWTSTVVMQRTLFDELGSYDESLRLGQDYDYWLRASRLTEIHRLAGVMALYRKHAESATMRGFSRVNHAARVVESAVEKWGLQSPNGDGISPRALRERLYAIYFSAGYGCYHTGRIERASREFRACLKLKPLALRSAAYFMLSSCAMLSHSFKSRMGGLRR